MKPVEIVRKKSSRNQEVHLGRDQNSGGITLSTGKLIYTNYTISHLRIFTSGETSSNGSLVLSHENHEYNL